MKPSVAFYAYWEQPSTEVAIRSTLVEDLYVILVSWGAGGEHATFRVFVNPLVTWLWLGVGIMVLGIAFCLLPKPRQAEGGPRQIEGEPRQIEGEPRQAEGKPRQVEGGPRQVEGKPAAPLPEERS
jgi:hypothetical protein